MRNVYSEHHLNQRKILKDKMTLYFEIFTDKACRYTFDMRKIFCH